MISNYFLPRKTVGWKSAQFLILKLFANRLKLRFKDKDENQLAHTLNGSSLALPRVLAGILKITRRPKES
jgi:hypothetical protein